MHLRVDKKTMGHQGISQLSSLLSAAKMMAGTNSTYRIAPRAVSPALKSEHAEATETRLQPKSPTQHRPRSTPVDSDHLSISNEARELQTKAIEKEQSAASGETSSSQESEDTAQLTDEVATDSRTQAQLVKLKATDRAVRAHEQAHISAAGGYAKGGASFSYTRGPDGKLYAVGGEVAIDSSPVPGDPDATIRKARVVRQAAMAPANPSGQDRSVAAAASQMAQEARVEKLKMSRDEKSADSSTNGSKASGTSSTSSSNGTPGQSTYQPITGGSPSSQAIISLLDLLA